MPSRFNDDTIQDVLDDLTEQLADHDGFIAVDFLENDEVICRFSELPADIPTSVGARTESGEQAQIPVRSEVGSPLTAYLGRVGVDALAPTVGDGTQGGDECRNANTIDYFGTLTIYMNNLSFKWEDKCEGSCTTSPALVSNNHVIARSDAGKKGERIWTSSDPHIATLNCFVPLKCDGSVDLAAATVRAGANVQKWTVREIGTVKGFRRPNLGEVVRKHGARTGLTTGKVEAKSNIKVDGRMYYGVFRVSRGFACPGDSGSPVIAQNGNLLGIHSWGDRGVPCDQKPVTYFFTFVNPGTRAAAGKTSVRVESGED